ncbi:hypothetical protein JOB18_026972, partial [Solea senegalensis]
ATNRASSRGRRYGPTSLYSAPSSGLQPGHRPVRTPGQAVSYAAACRCLSAVHTATIHHRAMAFRYTSTQLRSLNHRAPPSSDTLTTVKQLCLLRRRPYIHRGSRRRFILHSTTENSIPTLCSNRSTHHLGHRHNNIRIFHPRNGHMTNFNLLPVSTSVTRTSQQKPLKTALLNTRSVNNNKTTSHSTKQHHLDTFIWTTPALTTSQTSIPSSLPSLHVSSSFGDFNIHIDTHIQNSLQTSWTYYIALMSHNMSTHPRIPMDISSTSSAPQPHSQSTTLHYPTSQYLTTEPSPWTLSPPLQHLVKPDSTTIELVDHYNQSLSSCLNQLAPLKTKTVSFSASAPWYTPDLHQLKRKRRQLERLHKKTGLTVHADAFKHFTSTYITALNTARSNYFSQIIHSNASNPRTLFTTFAQLTKPKDNITSTFTTNKCNNYLSFFHSKIKTIHTTLHTCLSSAPPRI